MRIMKTDKIKSSTEKKNFPKPAAIAIFWGLGLLLAFVLVKHHNPLADQVTEQMKKFSGCVLISRSGTQVPILELYGLWHSRL